MLLLKTTKYIDRSRHALSYQNVFFYLLHVDFLRVIDIEDDNISLLILMCFSFWWCFSQNDLHRK